MSRAQDGMRSQRQNRVGEVLRHAVAEILARGDLRDPDLKGVSVTVTEVAVSPDLKNATAFIMPLGGGDADRVEEALNRCARYVRGQVSKMVTLRYSPQIRFAVDTSFDSADRIKSILDKPGVRRDLDSASAGDGPDQD